MAFYISQEFSEAEEWFENLRDEIVSKLEKIEKNKFPEVSWLANEDGGGNRTIIKGKIIEKGGVNFSSVGGKFNKNMADKIPGTMENLSYHATGISVVLHPKSPHIPSMHFNTRYLETEKQWYGGGMDITPCLFFEKEKDYHQQLKSMCDKHDKEYYDKFKKWCDEYFYLKHRAEPRGIGGIFFDYLFLQKRIEGETSEENPDFDFVKDVGIFFKEYAINLINNLMNKSWTPEDKDAQLKKRSRYVEFNLLYDRGTRFGLETGGNIDAILMSMPPLAKWD